MPLKNHKIFAMFLVLMTIPFIMGNSCMDREKVGVLYVVHGGQDDNNPKNTWDTSIQMFSYNPNHPVYQMVIWNSAMWGIVMKTEEAEKFLKKFDFEYERIGGTDPFQTLTDKQFADLQAELESNKSRNVEFVYDWACWMCGDRLSHYPYPRYIYNDPTGKGDNVTYCGEDEDDGPWSDCDPQRYNVDGPADRFIAEEVDRIIIVDMTVGGVRFFKTYDVVQMFKRALADKSADIPLTWVNDPTNLMERSYPTEPEGWTYTLGEPDTDPSVPLDANPNPVSSDPGLALLQVKAIETSMSESVSEADTGIIILNHATREWGQMYDPKIDDTLVLNKNIKAQLLERNPDIDPANIIGAYMGVKEINPENDLLERTREMRGENIGHAYLYEVVPATLPAEEWGYLYWDALEYLKDRGVKHIVIGFPQIVTDSVLNLVEFHNQIAKEIGYKNWLYWGIPDDDTYPGVGHPFTDYWGNWADTDCGDEECCFEMGGCDDGRPYPPPRQEAIDSKRGDMDPSLAYDVCEYGHLGYDPEIGPPDPNKPVQAQYTGTWAMYRPPNNDPGLVKLLAKHVLNAALGKLE